MGGGFVVYPDWIIVDKQMGVTGPDPARKAPMGSVVAGQVGDGLNAGRLIDGNHGRERGISALALIQGPQHTLADASVAIDCQPVCHGLSLHRTRSELIMYQTPVNSQQVWCVLKKLIFSGKYRIFGLLCDPRCFWWFKNELEETV